MKYLLSLLLTALATCHALALEINQATAPQLETIKGIGPVTSQAIMDARKDKPFSSWADLQARIKGVGTNTAKKWSDQGLTVQGAKLMKAMPAEKKATK